MNHHDEMARDLALDFNGGALHEIQQYAMTCASILKRYSGEGEQRYKDAKLFDNLAKAISAIRLMRNV